MNLTTDYISIWVEDQEPWSQSCKHNPTKSIVVCFYQSGVWINILNQILQNRISFKGQRLSPQYFLFSGSIPPTYLNGILFISLLRNYLWTTDFLIDQFVVTELLPHIWPAFRNDIKYFIFLLLILFFLMLVSGFAVLWSFGIISWLMWRTWLVSIVSFLLHFFKHFPLQTSVSMLY